jgi:SAM-dependent methyltransferase
MSNFQKYSVFYDLLYRDKDYAVEAAYVAQMIRKPIPLARTILELGSGTGRHGRHLAAMGFDVHGIERSPDMVFFARASSCPPCSDTAGSFACEVGDICTAHLGRTFDAVISLFHVISYQTTNQSLQAAFQVATDHLAPGGLFLFDVWHGPAVLSQGLSERVKEVADERYRVKRTARPELDTNRSTVKVVYQMNCENLMSGENVQFSEEHVMRYLFPTEVDILAENCGMRCVATEEFLTGEPPSPSTWGVTYVLQK